MNQLNLLILNQKINQFLETNDITKFCDWVNKNINDSYLEPVSIKEFEKATIISFCTQEPRISAKRK